MKLILLLAVAIFALDAGQILVTFDPVEGCYLANINVSGTDSIHMVMEVSKDSVSWEKVYDNRLMPNRNISIPLMKGNLGVHDTGDYWCRATIN